MRLKKGLSVILVILVLIYERNETEKRIKCDFSYLSINIRKE